MLVELLGLVLVDELALVLVVVLELEDELGAVLLVETVEVLEDLLKLLDEMLDGDDVLADDDALDLLLDVDVIEAALLPDEVVELPDVRLVVDDVVEVVVEVDGRVSVEVLKLELVDEVKVVELV